MTTEYETHLPFDSDLGGIEGHTYQLLNLHHPKAFSQEKLLGIIEKHIGKDDEFTSYQDGYGSEWFQSNHSTWLEFFESLLEGNRETCVDEINIEIFQDLVNQKIINNCLLLKRQYHAAKHGGFYEEISKPIPIVGNAEDFLTTKDVMDELKIMGRLIEVTPGIFKRI